MALFVTGIVVAAASLLIWCSHSA